MIAAPRRRSRSESRDISSCQVRCSCSVSPLAAEKSWECSSSPDHGASDGPVTCASLQSCSSVTSRSDSRSVRSAVLGGGSTGSGIGGGAWGGVEGFGTRRGRFELLAGFDFAGFKAPGLVLGLEHHVALERLADL